MAPSAPSSSSSPTSSLPSYISPSPVGYHLKVQGLLQFLVEHAAPSSTDPDRKAWATEESQDHVMSIFPPDLAGETLSQIFIYNKSRDIDRICPSCRLVYRVGDGPNAYSSFEHYLNRYTSATAPIDRKVLIEQDLSGICSGICFERLNDDSNQMTDKYFSDLAHAHYGDILATEKGWLIRKSTHDEWKISGVKVIWEKVVGK